MIWLKQSTASQEIPLGYFLDSSDGNSEETGLTIANTDIKLWKTGATSLANKNSGGATHISNGVYYCTLDATDTDTLGPMVVFVHVTGALTVRLETLVLPANVYDSLVAGSDTLQADVTQIGGDAQSATDLKDFVDAGYDPSTNQVEGVKTVDTTTTNSDMRGTDSALLAANVNVAAGVVEANVMQCNGGTVANGAIPNAAAGANGGLPTVDANNRVAGVQGTKNTFDDLNDISAANVNSEVDDVINTDAAAELSSIPAANASLGDKIKMMSMVTRNGGQANGSTIQINKDDGSALGSGSIGDDGTTFTRGKVS